MDNILGFFFSFSFRTLGGWNVLLWHVGKGRREGKK